MQSIFRKKFLQTSFAKGMWYSRTGISGSLDKWIKRLSGANFADGNRLEGDFMFSTHQ